MQLWPRVVAYCLGVGFAGPVLTYQTVMMNVSLMKWLGDRTKIAERHERSL